MAAEILDSNWLDAGARLAAALGCGLLVGTERERRKGQGPDRALAGIRSFTLASVLGCACMLAGGLLLVAVGAAMVAGLNVAAYWRSRSGDPGVTTEIALLLTFVTGAICVQSLPLAAALAVGMTALLAAREPMHRFALHWLSEAEIRDGLLLGALALIALPLVPDRPLWGPVLNPYVMTRLLVLLLGIQALAHFAARLLMSRHALALSAFASGFASSTATVASLGLKVRQANAPAKASAGAALLSCVATLLQLLVVAVSVSGPWLKLLWLPTLGGAVVALLWGVWIVRSGSAEAKGVAGETTSAQGRMFSLREAFLIAALLTGIQAGVHGLSLWLGKAGLLAGTLLASLFEVHAAMAAIFVQGPPDAPGGAALVRAVALGVVVHALAKCVNAGLTGGAAYARAFVPGQLVHTAVFVGLLVLI
ncbi:DUF4010 domain-containing protein [bacterium BD-1]|nr:DUF4010 domain-containing protein [Ottowia caeni]